MPAKLDLSGVRFTRLTAVRATERRQSGSVLWECRCVCGRTIFATTSSLRSGNTKSCGCLHEIHGQTNTRLFKVWGAIKQRTGNPTCEAYPDYGGRGIKMYKAWRKSFQVFRDYVVALPNFDPRLLLPPDNTRSVMELDRENNDKSYVPGNVRWATRKQQVRNRRVTPRFTFEGIGTLSLKDACEYFGVPYARVQKRLQNGYSVEDAFKNEDRRKTRFHD